MERPASPEHEPTDSANLPQDCSLGLTVGTGMQPCTAFAFEDDRSPTALVVAGSEGMEKPTDWKEVQTVKPAYSLAKAKVLRASGNFIG